MRRTTFLPPFKSNYRVSQSNMNSTDGNNNFVNQNNNSLVNNMDSQAIDCSTNNETNESDSQSNRIDCGVECNVVAKDGTALRSVNQLPSAYRCVFEPSFPIFNVIQSKVFDDIMTSDNSVVVCAPTGSGKTVILELAIVRLLIKAETEGFKIGVIYMAPLKALCNEKENEWKKKFKNFNLKICQLTGDSNIEDYTQLNDFNILLTTPEKWDSITRNWRETNLVIKSMQLMLIDEVHLIHDGIRGATMEAVISRMKTLRKSGASYGKQQTVSNLRFVAVSATAPNADDISLWLSSDNQEPISYNMSDELRPVKLKHCVYGYYFNQNWNEFQFDINLSYKLGSVIKTHSDNKPTLVFCSTRKSVEMSVKTLIEQKWKFQINHKQHMDLQKSRSSIQNQKIRDAIQFGMGFHHAGLHYNDRNLIEKLFAEGILPVLISTSTLAMGINLPAHLVIIKNTRQFASGSVSDYSETTILQMIGRAGRPQFDKTATAVIMTKANEQKKYENIINGSQIIESNLHKHLAEHLNSEIVRNTIDRIEIAIEWLRSTYFYIRATKNPKYYQINASPTKESDKVVHMIQQMCKRELNGLNAYGMIRMDSDCCSIASTQLGNIMAKNCISLNTMKRFLEIMKKEMTLKELIESIALCDEISQDVMIRGNEKKALNELNHKTENMPSIRYAIAGRIKTAPLKINCLIQATFGSLTITEQSLTQDSNKIMRSGQRISKCLTETLILQLSNYKTLLNSIILMKCFRTRLWYDTRYVTKQMKGIGISLSTLLVDRGFTSFDKLLESDPRDLEMVLSRHPPFGKQLKEEISLLPRYTMSLEQNMDKGLHANKASFKVTIKLLNFDEMRNRFSKSYPNNHCCYLIVGNDDNKLFCCQKITDNSLLKNDGIWFRNNLEIEKGKSKYVYANYLSESFCGLDQHLKIKPQFIKQESDSSQESVCDETNRFDTLEGCQHRCLNKMNCLHDCCKKGLDSQKATKRKTANNENKNSKRTKIERIEINKSQQTRKKQRDGSLANWVIKKSTDDRKNPLKTNERSEYFLKDETKNLNDKSNYDEYDKQLDDEIDLGFPNEDFQNFESDINTNRNSLYFDMRQWSLFIPSDLPENPNFFFPQ